MREFAPDLEVVESHRCLEVVQLLRGSQPERRGAEAARRLLELTQALPTDALLTLTVGSNGETGNAVRLEVNGPVPPAFADDLAWAFDGVAELEPSTGSTPPVPTWLAEITSGHGHLQLPGPMSDEPDDFMRESMRRQQLVRRLSPWPRATYVDLADVLQLNSAQSAGAGLVFRSHLAPAGPVECQLIADLLLETWDTANGNPHDYLGRPLRVRALVGGYGDRPPARVRALIRRWGMSLDLLELDPEDVAALWAADPKSTVGHAVPFGLAQALVRVPVAGSSFPGMTTADQPVELRPLDPVPPTPQRGIRLGRARNAGGDWVDVVLSQDDLTQHCFVQGSSGSGKSTLLASIALAAQEAGAGYTLLDPEGSTIDAVLRGTQRHHAERVRVVRHGHAELDAPLNLLHARPDQLERMLEMFTEMIQRAQDPNNQGMVGPRWRRWFTLIARACTLVDPESASLVMVAALASDMERVKRLAKAVEELDPEIAHRLRSEYVRLSSENATEMISWGVSKLGVLLTSERARWIFGAGPDAIDVCDVMDSGQSLLVDLGAHRLGEPVGRMIGASYLLKYWAALSQRQDRQRRHFIIVDEAHLFSYGPLPKLLAEARKFGVGVIVATQHLGQLTGELGDALESNTGSFVSLRVGLQSAARAATRLEEWPMTELVRLPNFTAAASINRDGLQSAPFSLEVDHHAQLQRLNQEGRIAPAVGTTILAAGRASSGVFTDLPAPTDTDILSRLERGSAGSADATSFLDDWLAKRARAQASDDRADAGAPATQKQPS